MIETSAEFQALAEAWDKLPGVNENPLLSYDWFSTAAATLHRDQRLQVATIWRGDQLAAAAPLVEIQRGGTVWLEFIGSKSLFEPCDVLFRDLDALRELARFVAALRRPIALQRVPLDSELASLLGRTGAGWIVRVRSTPCRRVDSTESWDSYLAGRSGRPDERRGDAERSFQRGAESVAAAVAARHQPSA